MDEYEKAFWSWLDGVVIAENFCPFAKPARRYSQIRYINAASDDTSQIILELCKEMRILDQETSIETTVIGLPRGFEDFYDYLDLLDICQNYIEHSADLGVYQIASFHPEYLFAEEDKNDLSHYTNRSPLPLLHIIREQSIEDALKRFHKPEQIPLRNKQHARHLGRAFFENFQLK